MSIRSAIGTYHVQATMEGAGVHLHRAFRFQDTSTQDPFLLLDDFGNDDPEASYSHCSKRKPKQQPTSNILPFGTFLRNAPPSSWSASPDR